MFITPCVSVCRLENNICVGCSRTLDEIAKWSKMTDEERMVIMKRLGYGVRKGGKRTS